jgi:hypothetical protein
MSRAQNTERSFTQRTSGVIKKANEVKNRFPNAKIGVYIFDGVDTLVYQSDDNWPPAMQETVGEIKAGEGKQKRKQLIYCPTDFITVSDVIRYGKLPRLLYRFLACELTLCRDQLPPQRTSYPRVTRP